MLTPTKWVFVHWTTIFLTAILSVIPLFIVGSQQREGNPVGEFAYLQASVGGKIDKDTFYASTDDSVQLSNSLQFCKVMAPFLGIALPSLMDVIVDIYVFVTQPRRTNNVVRLSLLERTIFVVGVFVNGLFLFFQSTWNPMLLFTIQSIFANINTLLTVAPMLTFMHRNTDTFTPFLTTLLLTLLCSGIVAINFTFLMVSDLSSITYNALYRYSEVSLSLCFGGIIFACSWSLFCYLSTNNQYFDWKSNAGKTVEEELDPYEAFNVYKVPALHMIALTTMCGVNIYWFNTPTIIPTNEVSLLNLLLLISTSLVLTIEMRVRQNEVMHGLFLLDSKKSFVRFISHEIRTPLSTALMGLELLGVDDLQSTARDETTEEENTRSSGAIASLPQEDYEALQLVHESLKVAASIFDNISEYDALGHENQKMNLQKSSINLQKLIHTTVRPLQLQARRNNVEMVVDCLDAMVNVDPRRMAQAIRALVSTAISLTPKEGSVRINLRLVTSENYDDSSPKNYVSDGPGLVGKRKNTFQFIKRASIVGSTIFATTTEGDAFNPMYAVVAIDYNGPGFDKADAKRANKKFFTFDPRELGGGGAFGYGTGSGLGLALAKFITDAHGGRLWIESEGVGKGERLSIGIPLSTVQNPRIPNPPRTIPEEKMETDSVIDLYRSTRQDSDKIMSRTSEMIGLSTGEGNNLPSHELTPIVTNRNANRLILPLSESLPSGQSSERGNHPPRELVPLDTNRNVVRIGLPPYESIPSAQSSERGIGTGILHVLVVEDSAVARGMLIRMMRSLKCTTAEAADGVEAVSMVQASINRVSDNNSDRSNDDIIENGQQMDARAASFDLILCDSVMPNMDGPTAVKLIRDIGFTNPILGVTGNTLPEQIEDFIAHGANAVLPKPVHFRGLKDAMVRILDGSAKETFQNSINRASRNTFESPTPRTPGMLSYREECPL